MFLERFCVYDMQITWSSGHVTFENEARGYIVITWREVHTSPGNQEKEFKTVIIFLQCMRIEQANKLKVKVKSIVSFGRVTGFGSSNFNKHIMLHHFTLLYHLQSLVSNNETTSIILAAAQGLQHFCICMLLSMAVCVSGSYTSLICILICRHS